MDVQCRAFIRDVMPPSSALAGAAAGALQTQATPTHRAAHYTVSKYTISNPECLISLFNCVSHKKGNF